MVARHAMPGRGVPGRAEEPRTAERGPWPVLVLLCAAQFMVILDMTVVTVALPSIGRSLGFAPADLQWVVTAYLLATGGLTLLGGRAADLVGGRRMFRTGLTLFTAASLASGLAPDAAALVASRAAQGVGAALLTPAALAVITATYSGIQRARALAVWGALASGGLALGVLAGGVLTTWLGWRSVFLINVPVGLVVFAAGRHLPPGRVPAGRGPVRGAHLRRLDLRGAALAVAGLVAGVYAGIGAGLAFPAASITALTTVRQGAEGLASGLLTTGHEVGAAVGAAVFPALAAGSALTAGYSHAFTVAAVAGAVLAVIAAAVVPAVRPAPGTRVGFH